MIRCLINSVYRDGDLIMKINLFMGNLMIGQKVTETIMMNMFGILLRHYSK